MGILRFFKCAVVGICMSAWIMGCSDFYRKDFIHITSAHQDSKEKQAFKEREIQAMRKSQILVDNHTRIVMIVRYMNEVDDTFGGSDNKEVFFVEIYDKLGQVGLKDLQFSLKNMYKSIEPSDVSKLSVADMEVLKPDVVYNDMYKVVFESIGARGKDMLRFNVEIVDVGSMSVDFSYAKAKSNLTK
ncbi:hypothetical protein OQH61_01090 [Helicobacter sp. MIT 21-1697]|uniref:hypothetical protein n=1 Tax=Helicobacter sp. MIT 21-1697 TaxID=2993733 RepID=UPI00224A6F59|nr:hypothetical protein [Helicobacter sp. MIT 21-1697]MCX2716335.1 hypothetical protein [Helicobacter sp. MIT 21-1697]